MNYLQEYHSKLKTPEEAVRIVKDGDWVDYTSNLGFPPLLDEALAARRDELHDVKIRGNLIFGPIKTAECDPSQEHFCYNSWHFSGYERKLCDRGLCYFIPMIFRNNTLYYKHFLDVNVAMMAVPPMDEQGNFSLSCATGVGRGILDKADYVILEVREDLPYLYSAFDGTINISEVDAVVEGPHAPLPDMPTPPASSEDIAIANHILPHIQDGAALQLGIGGMPNVLGELIAESDVKDLSMHTELCGDAYMVLDRAGKITNKKKTLYRGKGLTGMVFGSAALYEWADHNPNLLAAPLSYVNDVRTIAQFDNMISINNCIAVDLYGQVNAESAGMRHISGTGGQLDFLTGTAMANGGKAFIAMTSTYKEKDGTLRSRIRPQFNGEIITDPRSQAYYIVTEYGAVNLCGRTTWERAERLISIAHPDFRDELIKGAETQHIWRASNKR